MNNLTQDILNLEGVKLPANVFDRIFPALQPDAETYTEDRWDLYEEDEIGDPVEEYLLEREGY